MEAKNKKVTWHFSAQGRNKNFSTAERVATSIFIWSSKLKVNFILLPYFLRMLTWMWAKITKIKNFAAFQKKINFQHFLRFRVKQKPFHLIGLDFQIVQFVVELIDWRKWYKILLNWETNTAIFISNLQETWRYAADKWAFSRKKPLKIC